MGNPNPDRQFYDHSSGTEVKSDQTVFDVVAWREAMQAAIEGTLITRASVHENVHDGKSFIAFHNNSSLADGSSINIYFETPASAASCPHIIIDANGSDAYDFEVLEAPTVTSATGTSSDLFNKNRQSAATSNVMDNEASPNTNKFSIDVTTTADGTIISSDTLSTGNKQGGQFDFGREFILKASTKYVFRLTSRANGNRVHINLDWYEPA